MRKGAFRLFAVFPPMLIVPIALFVLLLINGLYDQYTARATACRIACAPDSVMLCYADAPIAFCATDTATVARVVVRRSR